MISDPVTDYAKQIVSGKLPSGKLQKLACKRHLDDLKRYKGKNAPFYWDLEFVLKKLSFFPQLKHWRGELAGKPFELMGWQTFCAGSLFGWFKKDNTYRFETAYISVPKKSGKSIFVGAIGLLRGFFDQEPGAEVYSIAMAKDQADIVWQEAAHLAMRSDNPLVRDLKVSTTASNVHHNIHDPTTASKFEPLSSDRDSRDGVNPYCLIADEVHRYKDAQLLNMLKESMASRRNRLTIEITTAGWDRSSICYEHDEFSAKVVEGLVDAPHWFTFICRADEKDRENWDSPKVWAKANPSFGVSIREDRVKISADEVRGLPSAFNDWLRYRLNVWTEQSERWVDIDRWRESGEGLLPVAAVRGMKAFGGLDLASIRDLCAFVLVVPVDELLHAYAWFWCPENGIAERSREDRVPYDLWVSSNLIKATPGDTADHRVIKHDILRIAEHFDIVQLGYDPYNAGNLPHELDEELGPIEARNPDTGRMEKLPRLVKFGQGFGSMAAPTKELERLYLEGKLKHGNNTVLNWMAGNVAVKRDEYENQKIDKQKSSEKVDGMVALAMAIGVKLKNAVGGEGVSVYEREGRGFDVF